MTCSSQPGCFLNIFGNIPQTMSPCVKSHSKDVFMWQIFNFKYICGGSKSKQAVGFYTTGQNV